MKRTLFLDQSAKIAGAELVLLDIAKFQRESCLVALFEDGPFRHLLEKSGVSVKVLAKNSIEVQRESGFAQGIRNSNQLIPLVQKVVQVSQDYDLIYANTLKALVVGAAASFLGRRPLIFHLHDILSKEHFSNINRRLVVTLANHFATRVIAVSQAARNEFIAIGGRADLVQVVYNGFDPSCYQVEACNRTQLRQELGIGDHYVVGHFSRLSPWKGQHILIEALLHCPPNVTALLVGDALFGEQDYVQQLHDLVESLKLHDRVKFLGFRSDVPKVMIACDLVTHTSTAPEPFGRVIVEAMLCRVPVVAAAAGGAVELVKPGETGWLVPPSKAQKLAEIINHCYAHPEQTATIAAQAQEAASKQFHFSTINQQIAKVLATIKSN